MKRLNHLYEKIYSIENLQIADKKARKGKNKQYGIKQHDLNHEENIQAIHEQLKNKTYKISEYTTFTIYEPKERLIFRLPYIDRIVQHAIMLQLEKIFTENFTADTYSAIKGKGIHAAHKSLQKSLKDISGTRYALKLDIKKFYPSIDHAVLKSLLRRKFKDQNLLWLLYHIIDSAVGLPIGNYLSQYVANFYLSGFDHWIKQELKVKYYFRYADDLVFLSADKKYLHDLLIKIRLYLSTLKLTVKDNHQVFPVEARSIDFVGYRFYHTHVLIRKSIKKKFIKAAKKGNHQSLAAYNGWLKHCNARNLERTYSKTT